MSKLLIKFMQFLASTYLGVWLIGMISLYLGVVSVMLQVSPQLLQAALGRIGSGVYGHPFLVALTGALVLNLLAASLTRIKFDLSRLGAHMSHAGIIAMLAGAAWYTQALQQGDCVSQLMEMPAADGSDEVRNIWTPIDRFYLQNTFALHAKSDGQADTRHEPLGDLRLHQQASLDATLECSWQTSVRAKRFFSRAIIESKWDDSAPRQRPAVELAIQTPHGWQQLVLSREMPDHQAIQGDGYILLHHPGVTAQTLERLLSVPLPQTQEVAVVIVLSGPVGQKIAVGRPGEKPTVRDIELGKPIEVPLSHGKLGLTVSRFFERAQMTLVARPAEPQEQARAVWALEVEVASGDWSTTTCLGYTYYPQDDAMLPIALPEGELLLGFSRVPRRLGQKFKILDAQYEVHPGSHVPRDYRCVVDIDDAGRHRQSEISLNNPLHLGPYQVSQSSWQDDPHQPHTIIFGVASRGGVWLVYVGMALIGLGMPLAFYLKPALLRRRRGS